MLQRTLFPPLAVFSSVRCEYAVGMRKGLRDPSMASESPVEH
jgi:hypothetical protein